MSGQCKAAGGRKQEVNKLKALMCHFITLHLLQWTVQPVLHAEELKHIPLCDCLLLPNDSLAAPVEGPDPSQGPTFINLTANRLRPPQASCEVRKQRSRQHAAQTVLEMSV